MSLQSRIEQAVREAPVVTNPLMSSSFEEFRRFSDDDIVPFNIGVFPVDMPGTVYVSDAQELEEALRIAHATIFGYRPCDGNVKSSVRHELQHQSATRQAGHRGDSLLAVDIIKTAQPNGSFLTGYYPYITVTDWHTTKLGIAAMAAYPSRPSDGDLRDIRAMGYEDIYDVARRIHQLNVKSGTFRLPMPLSVDTAQLAFYQDLGRADDPSLKEVFDEPA